MTSSHANMAFVSVMFVSFNFEPHLLFQSVFILSLSLYLFTYKYSIISVNSFCLLVFLFCQTVILFLFFPLILPDTLCSWFFQFHLCIHNFLFLILSLCLALQPFRIKVKKSPSTSCCWTDCLVSTRLHYKPLSTTSIGEKHKHWYPLVSVYVYLCPCVLSLHLF